MRISWQITGIRQDAWANAHRIPVEEEKEARLKGSHGSHRGEASLFPGAGCGAPQHSALCDELRRRRQGLNVEARHALRQQQSRPLLSVIRKQIGVARPAALPGGALAKACNYTLTLWDKLTRFLEYPELEWS